MRMPFFVDHSSGARLPVKGCMVAFCVLCGKKQYLSRLALNRRTRQMCGCGGALELSATTQKREGLAPTAMESREMAKPRACMFCHASLRLGNADGVCGCLECQKIKAILWSNGVVLREVESVQKGVVDGRLGYRIVGLSQKSKNQKEFVVHVPACRVSMRMVGGKKPEGWPKFVADAGARTA